MGYLRETIPPQGLALTPLQVIRHVRWVGDLTDDEIVAAIHAAAGLDMKAKWPELRDTDLVDLRYQCEGMTKSRLRAWKAHGDRQPTWLEVRALLSGLHTILKDIPADAGEQGSTKEGRRPPF